LRGAQALKDISEHNPEGMSSKLKKWFGAIIRHEEKPLIIRGLISFFDSWLKQVKKRRAG